MEERERKKREGWREENVERRKIGFSVPMVEDRSGG